MLGVLFGSACKGTISSEPSPLELDETGAWEIPSYVNLGEDQSEVADDSSEARRARNEVVFRTVNEEIKALIDADDIDLPLAPFICECGDRECRELIRVPLAEYSDVRASPRRFILATGHDRRDGKETTTVETHDGFVVVEKTGVAGEIAEEHGEKARRA
jgi:hypothetical protein